MRTTDEVLAHLAASAAASLDQATGLEPSLYWNSDIAAAEDQSIFRKDWVCPGLAADIPNPGDYLTFSIAGDPVFSVRDKSGAIRTYSNVCRHRMMQLLQGRGHTNRIVCPYHAWTYDLNGALIGAPHMERSTGFDKKTVCLPEIRTEIWNGWIFITQNPDARPVGEMLAALLDVVSRYDMQNYVPMVREDHVWQTNWKLLAENFMEGYHLPVAHKATVGAWFPVGETRFPAEVFDDFTYQTFKKTGDAKYGLAHKANTSLTHEWRDQSVMPTVFPTLMYVLAPDHMWYLSLRPKGIGEVHVRFGVALAPEVHASLENPDAALKDLVQFFEHVNAEDRGVVEGIYNGSRSRHAEPGRLSWLEREIHDFQKYLARRLIAAKGDT